MTIQASADWARVARHWKSRSTSEMLHKRSANVLMDKAALRHCGAIHGTRAVRDPGDYEHSMGERTP